MTGYQWDNTGASRFSKPRRIHYCECEQPVSSRNLRPDEDKTCYTCGHKLEPKESDEREASHR